MKTYILTTVIFLTFFNASLFSQTNNDNINKEKIVSKFSIGAGIGYTTGYGASFRYTPGKFGVQANFSPIYEENDLEISAGLTFLYTLIESEYTSFYLYQANHYKYFKYSYYLNNYNDTYTRSGKSFNNGIGCGIEFTFLKRISLNIMGGFGFYKNFERLNLTGEAGLYYKL